MSHLQETIVRWADERMEAMLACPRMWGSLESVEMQVLQLLELRALARRPEVELANPRRVLDAYLTFLRDRFPKQPPEPLFRLLLARLDDSAAPPEFAVTLREFRDRLSKTTLLENPFEHSQLAIRLTFDQGRPPSTSAFTSYYEEFRRAARAATRPSAPLGRHKKDIERATDFSLEDAVVSPANGAPAEVLLRLGPGAGQKDFDAESSVRDALSSILTLADWASSGDAVAELGVDEPYRRTHTALQAMRILPRRGVKLVAVGGKLVVRSKPVELRPEQRMRFMEVVGAESPAEPFDETEEIRAIDLDRGVLLLGRDQRLRCFVRPETFEEVTEAGVRARVVGRLFRPLGRQPFVLADSVEPDEPAAPDD